MTPNPYMSTKNPSARKPLRQFSETLNAKNNTAVCRLCAAKTKLRAIRKINMLWSNIAKRRGHTKINQKLRKSLYNWILHHRQVMQSPIAGDCLYGSIDVNSKNN